MSAEALQYISHPASRSSSVYGGDNAAKADLWSGNPFPLSDPQHHEVKKAQRAAVVRRMPPLQNSNLKYRLSDVILEEAHQHQSDVIATASSQSIGAPGDRSISPAGAVMLPPSPLAAASQCFTESALSLSDITAGAVFHGGSAVWVCRRDQATIDVLDSLSTNLIYSIRISDQLLAGAAADSLAAREAAAGDAESSSRNLYEAAAVSCYPSRICSIAPRFALVGLSDGRVQVYDTIAMQALCETLPPRACTPTIARLLSRDDVERVAHVLVAGATEEGTALNVIRFHFPAAAANFRKEDDLGNDDGGSGRLETVVSKVHKDMRATCVFATADVTTLLVGDRSGSLWRVDLNDLNAIATIQIFPRHSNAAKKEKTDNSFVTALTADEKGLLVCGCSDGSVRLLTYGAATAWTTPVLLYKLDRLHLSSPVTHLALESCTRRCWSAAKDGSVVLWSLDPNRHFEVLRSSRCPPLGNSEVSRSSDNASERSIQRKSEGSELVDFQPIAHADAMGLMTLSSNGINHFWATQFVVSEAEVESAVHEADQELARQAVVNDSWDERVKNQRLRNEQRVTRSVNTLAQFSLLRTLRAAYWKFDKYRLMRRLYHKREAAVALLVKAEVTSARTVAFWRLLKLRDERRAAKERQKSVQTVELCIARRLQRRAFILWEEFVRRTLRQRKRQEMSLVLRGNISAFSRRLWMHRWQLSVQARVFRKKQRAMALVLQTTRSNQLLLAYYARWRDERRRREAAEHRCVLIREMTSQSGFHFGSRFFTTWRLWSHEQRALRDKRHWSGTVLAAFQRFALQTAFSTWLEGARRKVLADAAARIEEEQAKLKLAEERHRFVQPRVAKMKQLEELRAQLLTARQSLDLSKAELDDASRRVETLKSSDPLEASSSLSSSVNHEFSSTQAPPPPRGMELVADMGHQSRKASQIMLHLKRRCLNLYTEMPFIEKVVERNKRSAKDTARSSYLTVQKVVLETAASLGRQYNPPSQWPVGGTEAEVRLFISKIPVEGHASIVTSIKTIAALADFLSPADVSSISFDSDLAVNGEFMLSLFDALNAGVAKRKMSLSIVK